MARSNDRTKPLMRPDRGRPARYDWWAPIASAIKKRSGARGVAPKSSPQPEPTPTVPTDLGLARGRREAPPPPPRRSPPPLPSSVSAGGGLKGARICAVHRRLRIRSPPTRTSSPPSTTWQTRVPPPLRCRRLMVCTSLHTSLSRSLY